MGLWLIKCYINYNSRWFNLFKKNYFATESECRSQVSTPVSTTTIPQYEDQLSREEIQKITEDTTKFQGVPHSASKSLDMLDNLEDVSSSISTRQVSCSDIKSTSKPFESKTFYDAKNIKRTSSASPFK